MKRKIEPLKTFKDATIHSHQAADVFGGGALPWTCDFKQTRLTDGTLKWDMIYTDYIEPDSM